MLLAIYVTIILQLSAVVQYACMAIELSNYYIGCPWCAVAASCMHYVAFTWVYIIILITYNLVNNLSQQFVHN